jgi:hypothetical protein
MENQLWKNIKSAKWVLIGLIGGSYVLQQIMYKPVLLHSEVFGVDGNGYVFDSYLVI